MICTLFTKESSHQNIFMRRGKKILDFHFMSNSADTSFFCLSWIIMKIVSFLPSIGEQFFFLWSIKTPKISVRSNFFNNAEAEINNVFGFFACLLQLHIHIIKVVKNCRWHLCLFSINQNNKRKLEKLWESAHLWQAANFSTYQDFVAKQFYVFMWWRGMGVGRCFSILASFNGGCQT